MIGSLFPVGLLAHVSFGAHMCIPMKFSDSGVVLWAVLMSFASFPILSVPQRTLSEAL